MTPEQRKSLTDEPRYLEVQKREVYELLASHGIGWHMFGQHVMFDSPFHYIQSEDPLHVLEVTLYHQANPEPEVVKRDIMSRFGLVTPSGAPAVIAEETTKKKGAV